MDRLKRINLVLQQRQKHYDPEIKLRILGMVENGSSAKDLASGFGITVKTIQNWQKRFDESGLAGLEDRPKPGRPPLLEYDKVQKCIDRIAARGDLVTARGVWEEIMLIYDVKYSLRSIKKILDRLGQTCKKANPVHARAATNAEADEWYAENMPEIGELWKQGYDVTSMDESKSILDSDSSYGYAKRGDRVYTTHQGRKQGINIIGGITARGKSVFRTEERFNSKTFIAFLSILLSQIGRTIVLVDNASYHKSKAVLKWLEEHPDIRLIYLPVGSPHLNVIEVAWSVYKRHMRQLVFHSMDEFRKESSKFLRTHKFKLDVLKKLESRLQPNAEARVLEARAQLLIKQRRK